jgi:hypothetical protein
LSDTTETPVTPSEPEAQNTDPKADASTSEISGQASTAAGATPASLASAASANGSPAKPAVDIDALIEAAAKAQSDAAERVRQAEIRSKEVEDLKAKYGRYAEIDEPLSKAQTTEEKFTALRDYAKRLAGDEYDPTLFIQLFAEDAPLPPEQIAPEELAAKLPDIIKGEITKAEKERQKREAQLAKEAADKKAAEDAEAAKRKQEEDNATREEYLAECAQDMAKHVDKFPLCNAWAHRVTADKVLAVAAGFAKVNGRAPTGEELFPAIEAEFVAELEKATGVRRPTAGQPTPVGGTQTAAQAAADLQAEIDRELEEIDNKRRVIKKDPSIPTGAPLPYAQTGRTTEDDILAELERMDQSKASRLTY